jgi:hypothetical protein
MKKFLVILGKYIILLISLGVQIYNYFYYKNMLQPVGIMRIEIISIYLIIIISLVMFGILIVDLDRYKDNIKEWFHKTSRSIKWAFRMNKNHEFDHAYFLQTIKWKLEDMLKFYSSDYKKNGYPVSMDAWKVKDDLEHAIYYLEIIIDDDDTKHKRFLHPIYSEYNCDKCTWKGDWFHEPKEQKEKDKGYKIYHPPHLICTTCMNAGMSRKERNCLLKKQQTQFELENKQFFDFVAKRFEFWWD